MNEVQTDDNTTEPLYPEPVKGPLSSDHSTYGRPGKWAGTDPDKHMRTYFIIFLVVICLLFIFAVKQLSGEKFIF